MTLEFDLYIRDEEQAKRFVLDFYRSLVRQTEQAGGDVVTQGRSPEVATHEAADDMKATAKVTAMLTLERGSDTLPWLTVGDVRAGLLPPTV